MTGKPLLVVEDLRKVFEGRAGLLGRKRQVSAVDGISFTVNEGETFGLVGESGSGKSTTARLLTRLIEPSAGSIRLAGEDLRALSSAELRRRRAGMQMVFQDPFASLNPRLSVGYQLAEPLLVHGICGRAEARSRVTALLERVGLNPRHAKSYPHEFSGGQRQRIAIARALAAGPQLIIADEAVSALDVSVRAQILNLMADIRREADLSMVFISHDLGVVSHVADRVAVMYRGRIVEIGPVKEVFRAPHHPYTRELLEAMPVAAPGARAHRQARTGATAGVGENGCHFAPRCPLAADRCRVEAPALASVAPRHEASCWRSSDVPPFALRTSQVSEPARRRMRRLQERFLTAAKVEREDAACAS